PSPRATIDGWRASRGSTATLGGSRRKEKAHRVCIRDNKKTYTEIEVPSPATRRGLARRDRRPPPKRINETCFLPLTRPRAADKKHSEAIRALANIWLKIIFAMWKNRAPYDEARLMAA
ncbi:MAG: hypothetical protein AB1609_21975, partial [Bacillota bacterium]